MSLFRLTPHTGWTQIYNGKEGSTLYDTKEIVREIRAQRYQGTAYPVLKLGFTIALGWLIVMLAFGLPLVIEHAYFRR